MKIDKICARNTPPLRSFEIDSLSKMVIIAGANGSGKTKLKEGLIGTFGNPSHPALGVEIVATRPEERDAWGAERLAIQPKIRNEILNNYINSSTRGGVYVGTVIQVESNRTVAPISFQNITLATPDPDDQNILLTYFLNPFDSRWQQLVNRIYAKAANRDYKIATYVKAKPGSAGEEALRIHPDSFVPYQQTFAKLLPGKTLCPIDPKTLREFHYKVPDYNGELAFSTLSSGEQEAVRLMFDLISQDIRHCVIIIDEPELHLHPALSFRLIEAMKDLGSGTNQLILFTHSADIISTYYSTGSVYFIDANGTSDNQARQLSKVNEHHSSTAKVVSANLGLFAVGKTLLFIEGREASIDRLVYYKVAQKYFPEAHMVPIGSVSNINALKEVVSELVNSVFGINLFMVRDRDGLTIEQIGLLESNPHMRCLKRRHIENYLFDEEVLSMVAKTFYLDDKQMDRSEIANALLVAAKECLNDALVLTVKDYVTFNGALPGPSIKAPGVRTLDQLEQDILSQIQSGIAALQETFSAAKIGNYIKRERIRLESSLASDQWKIVFPGKYVLARFCGKFWGMGLDKVRQAYVDLALERKPEALEDLVDIMKYFRETK